MRDYEAEWDRLESDADRRLGRARSQIRRLVAERDALPFVALSYALRGEEAPKAERNYLELSELLDEACSQYRVAEDWHERVRRARCVVLDCLLWKLSQL